MGMDADVIAIGKFQKSIKHCLDYHPSYYKDVNETSKVIVTVFSCNTTDASRRLAKALSIDPWDFNQHNFNPNQVNITLLREMVEEGFLEDEKWIDDFLRLKEAGFEFFYRPNG
jgi:hypothetical protein